ncbi:MAG: GatB/YqeY domain-containing protein [Burkholderiales bacterium]|nr:GatB/YqeY domain-containing protein [Burkholderiales bacterium]MDQ3197015.1 GatB/YqeY domain-containing protein [Pseudomonadota bacterium]
MSIKHRVTEEMKAAMRAKDAPRLSAIRLLLAAIKQREIDERIELSDADVVAVIEKMLKQGRDSIAQFEAAGRRDLADVEAFESSVLMSYMPEPLSGDEIAAEVSGALAATGAKTMQDMGKVMAILKPELAGRADQGQVAAIVKARLAG